MNTKISFTIAFFLMSISYAQTLNLNQKEKKKHFIYILDQSYKMPFVENVFNQETNIYNVTRQKYKFKEGNFFKRHFLNIIHGYNNRAFGFTILYHNAQSHFDFFYKTDISKNVFMTDSLNVKKTYHKFNSVSPELGIKYSTRKLNKSNGIALLMSAGANYNFLYKKRDDLPEHNILDMDSKNIISFVPFFKTSLMYEYKPPAEESVTRLKNGGIKKVSSSKNFIFLTGFSYNQYLSNFFNTDYLINNVKPYQNYNSKFGYITFDIKIGFGHHEKQYINY